VTLWQFSEGTNTQVRIQGKILEHYYTSRGRQINR
jgi:hypothetical protein